MTEDATPADHPAAGSDAAMAGGKPLSATYATDGTNLTISFPLSSVECQANSPPVYGHKLPAAVTMDRHTLTISAPLASLRVKPKAVAPGAPVLKAKPAA